MGRLCQRASGGATAFVTLSHIIFVQPAVLGVASMVRWLAYIFAGLFLLRLVLA